MPQPCLSGDDQEGDESDRHCSRDVRPQQHEPAIHAVADHSSSQESEELRDGRADTEDREPCRVGRQGVGLPGEGHEVGAVPEERRHRAHPQQPKVA